MLIHPDETLDNFDPNGPQGKIPEMPIWATCIPGRNPEFKIHTGRGNALNAIRYTENPDKALYKYDTFAKRWVELYREEDKSPPDCFICGENLALKKDEGPFTKYSRYLNGINSKWVNTKHDDIHRVFWHGSCESPSKKSRKSLSEFSRY